MASFDFETAFLLFFVLKTVLSPAIAVAVVALAVVWLSPGGVAWALSRAQRSIPGPTGVVLALAGSAAHRTLAGLARALGASRLMAFSVGFTRFIVTSHPDTAKEILNSSAFADRPIKESAYELLFHRAMVFAPFGEYWRNLRRISATHLFSPKRIAALGGHRQEIGRQMVGEIKALMGTEGVVEVKRVLHFGSLNNVMMSVFRKKIRFWEGGRAGVGRTGERRVRASWGVQLERPLGEILFGPLTSPRQPPPPLPRSLFLPLPLPRQPLSSPFPLLLPLPLFSPLPASSPREGMKPGGERGGRKEEGMKPGGERGGRKEEGMKPGGERRGREEEGAGKERRGLPWEGKEERAGGRGLPWEREEEGSLEFFFLLGWPNRISRPLASLGVVGSPRSEKEVQEVGWKS